MSRIKIISVADKISLHPLTINHKISDLKVAGFRYADLLKSLTSQLLSYFDTLCIREDFFPSNTLIAKIANHKSNFIVLCPNEGIPVFWNSSAESNNPFHDVVSVDCDKDSFIIKYPWDILRINEILISQIDKSEILCELPNNVTINGFAKIAKSAKILPGTYIEGNVIIGENCKIGPNCYLRGNTYIGDNCHVGQAVEIKNSIFMEKVSAGHLSYIGDSVIGFNVNLGAGTITANLRHDGKNNKSDVDGQLVDTGRRKLGTIIGDNVHTGIHTSIYPGRKIWPDKSTRPGEIVQKDLK